MIVVSNMHFEYKIESLLCSLFLSFFSPLIIEHMSIRGINLLSKKGIIMEIVAFISQLIFVSVTLCTLSKMAMSWCSLNA